MNSGHQHLLISEIHRERGVLSLPPSVHLFPPQHLHIQTSCQSPKHTACYPPEFVLLKILCI